MMIESVEVIPYALGFRVPYVTGTGRLDRRLLLLVKIHTSEGELGLGETGPLMLRGGPSLEEIAACIRTSYAPELEGVSPPTGDPAEIVAKLRAVADVPQALAGVDLALWDLAGKLAGQPVWRMLGADERPSVECNATLTAGPPQNVAAQASAWAADGFRTFKLKLGTDHDVEQVAATREELGKEARIRVDANATWMTAEAVDTLAKLAAFDIQLCEQPVATVAQLAEVRRASAIPLVADESVISAAGAQRAMDAGACDAVTVKLTKVGGISAAREIVDAVPTYLSSALDGPLGIAAALHVSGLLPKDGFAAGLAQGLATGRLFADTVATDDRMVSGAPMMSPPSAPGLGVEIDEDALAAVRL